MAKQKKDKSSWLLYTVTIIVSFLVLIFIDGFLTLTSPFGAMPLLIYVLVAILSAAIGLATAFVLRSFSKTDRSFLVGCTIVSFLAATVLSSFAFLTNILNKEMQGLSASVDGATAVGSLSNFYNSIPYPFQ